MDMSFSAIKARIAEEVEAGERRRKGVITVQ